MKKRILPKTIRGKIMTLTAAITTLITVITVTICFLVFQSFLTKNQLQSTEFNLQLVANNVSSDMNDIVYLVNWCCSNSEILDYLEAFDGKAPLAVSSKVNSSLKPLALSTYKRMKEEYFNTRSSDFISRIIISANNQNNYLQIIGSSENSSPKSADIIASLDYFEQLYHLPNIHWIGFQNDSFSNVNPPQIIPIVRPVYDDFNSTVMGWAYVAVSSQLFTNYLNDYPLEEDSLLYITIGGQMYAVKNQVFVEFTPDFTVLDEIKGTVHPSTKAQRIRLSTGEKRMMVTCPMEQEGWYVSQIISQQQTTKQRQVYLLLIAGICLAIFSLGFVLMVFLNRIISRPVDKIRGKIDDIAHGDFSQDLSIEWEHELGEIGRGINALSRNVVTLMDKRVADEKQKKDLEYQILQSQINPHFLYNTLNSIKWMATIQNAVGIAEMTTALARLMKNVSKGSAALIPLREELDLVKDYFLIQQYRYGGSISIEYQIQSEDLYHCLLHRFSLQPIIENALFHGIEPKGTAGKITVFVQSVTAFDPHSGNRNNTGGGINSEAVRKELQISITDDGIGMSEDMIQKVLSGSKETHNDFFKQVGINNVNQRIQHDFGSTYGITITSDPGVYTTMIIRLPYLLELPDGKEKEQ